MRKELFEELVASVKQMKDIQAGRLKPGRVTLDMPATTPHSGSTITSNERKNK